MTERLYYEDCYLRAFDAHVRACEQREAGYAVLLDRSAFYPTSGGQPFDTGTLGAARVTDVSVDDAGEVWHMVDAPFTAGESVHGEIDWARRFDHMQQHAGEHLLANAAQRILSGHTIGLHLGAEVSTIDMTLPGGKTHASDAEIRALEDDVNNFIQRDVPIRCWFPDPEELKALPLRKPPAVDEHIRIVQIGAHEFCACGGTHPASAGQIGLFKIVDARSSRGKLRIAFVCGKRAYDLLRTHYDLATAIASLLSTSVGNIPNMVFSILEQQKITERALSEAQKKLLFAEIPAMRARGADADGRYTVIAERIEGDASAARELAAALAAENGVIALIGAAAGEQYVYVAARAGDVKANMGAILSQAAKESGGKGGGRLDFAQGGGPAEMLDRMREQALLCSRAPDET
jgi:alanyl-tRNA synthetase